MTQDVLITSIRQNNGTKIIVAKTTIIHYHEINIIATAYKQ